MNIKELNEFCRKRNKVIKVKRGILKGFLKGGDKSDKCE